MMKFTLENNLRGTSDEELIEELKMCAKKLNRETLTREEFNQCGKGHCSTIVRRFGSWQQALVIAGLEQSRSQINISEEDLLNNIKDVWTQLGRQPRYSELKKPISKYSAGTYENRFGSWTKALEYFVNWVNNVGQSSFEENSQMVADSSLDTPLIKHKTKREISDRLRFKILVRDGFKCLACGASPLKSAGVELHVDHILPWSKGGETIDENLQTKCKQCNLGKGNAFNS
jgi:hypothetical protein